jgi:hypothetical protein
MQQMAGLSKIYLKFKNKLQRAPPHQARRAHMARKMVSKLDDRFNFC